MQTFTRQLKGHEHDKHNRYIDIFADQPDPATGASRQYRFVVNMRAGVRLCTEISFHTENAFVDKERPNGLSPESVLAVLIDQLDGLGGHDDALGHLASAQKSLTKKS